MPYDPESHLNAARQLVADLRNGQKERRTIWDALLVRRTRLGEEINEAFKVGDFESAKHLLDSELSLLDMIGKLAEDDRADMIMLKESTSKLPREFTDLVVTEYEATVSSLEGLFARIRALNATMRRMIKDIKNKGD